MRTVDFTCDHCGLVVRENRAENEPYAWETAYNADLCPDCFAEARAMDESSHVFIVEWAHAASILERSRS